MRLNPDCIRDILFSIEDMSSYGSFISSSQLANTDSLKKYTEDELLYHLRQLDWNGYIVTPSKNKTLDGIFFVTDLSPIGHEFISNIRKDTNWNKVKKISKDVGSETLSSIKTIAENVITTAINASMGLH